MQILFDTDCLIQALENLENSAVSNLCRQGRCKGWLVSTSVPAILAGAGGGDEADAAMLFILG